MPFLSLASWFYARIAVCPPLGGADKWQTINAASADSQRGNEPSVARGSNVALRRFLQRAPICVTCVSIASRRLVVIIVVNDESTKSVVASFKRRRDFKRRRGFKRALSRIAWIAWNYRFYILDNDETSARDPSFSSRRIFFPSRLSLQPADNIPRLLARVCVFSSTTTAAFTSHT